MTDFVSKFYDNFRRKTYIKPLEARVDFSKIVTIIFNWKITYEKKCSITNWDAALKKSLSPTYLTAFRRQYSAQPSAHLFF